MSAPTDANASDAHADVAPPPPPPLAAFLPPHSEAPAKPYRGINSFRFADAPIFFAREEDVRRLTRVATVYRGVLLYGQSGVGKSSLINAGFVPEMIRQGFSPERLRVRPHPGEEIVVERMPVSPDGAQPYLPSLLLGDDGAAPGTPQKATLSIAEFVRRARATTDTEHSPLLIIDQFEEFVTLFEEAPPEGLRDAAPSSQAALSDALVSLLTDHSVPVKIVFSFREDYLARLTRLLQRVPGLAEHCVRLLPPKIADLDAIIRGPLRRFPAAFGGRIPDALVDKLIEAFRSRVGPGQVVPSEVQIACRKLYDAADPEALLAERGVEGILGDYFSDEIRKFPGREETIGVLLSRMVTRSGVRNVVSKDDLLTLVRDETRTPPEALEALLVAMDGNETRLVQSEQRQNVIYYTIASEFLIPSIREAQERRAREAERRGAEERLAAEREEAARRLAAERAEAERRVSVERAKLDRELERQKRQAEQQKKRRAIVAATILGLMVVALGTMALALKTRNGQLRRAQTDMEAQMKLLRETNALFSNLKDSTDLVARRRADSLISIVSMTAVAVARADSLHQAAASVQDQLKAERRARVALEQRLGADTSVHVATDRAYQSANAALSSSQDQLRDARMLIARYAALIREARSGKSSDEVRRYVEKMCEREPQLCPAPPPASAK